MIKPGSVTRAGFARSPICGTYFFCGLHIASNRATVGVACKMQVTLERKIAMSHTAVLLHSTRRTRATTVAIRSFAIIIFALWFALSFTLGARGAFLNRPGTPPFALLTAVVVPIGVFLSVYWTSRAFHDFVLTADVALLTATQSWPFAWLLRLASRNWRYGDRCHRSLGRACACPKRAVRREQNVRLLEYLWDLRLCSLGDR